MTLAENHFLILALVAVMVAAPLLAAAAVMAGISRSSPRTPAAVALGLAFLAANGLAWLWHTGDGVACEFGDRLGGGSFIHVDGITTVLLPFVALVMLANLLVAPKRFLDVPATARILGSASGTFALFATAHPILIVMLST